MIRIARLVLLLGMVFAGKASATQEIALACEDCSGHEEHLCAVAIGEQLSLPDQSRVWIFDVPNGEVSTHRLSVIPAGSDAGAQHVRRSSGLVATAEPLPASEHAALKDWMALLRDELRPAGGARPVDECILSGGAVEALRSDRLERFGLPALPPVVFDTKVPPDIVETGFEGSALSLGKLGPWFEEQCEFANRVSTTFRRAWSAIDNRLRVPVETGLRVRALFADNSSGLLYPDPKRDGTISWELDLGSLADSDGNPIPSRVRDIADRLVFSGQPPGENNLERQIRRMQRLGVDVVDSTVPGGAAAECRKNDAGNWTCTMLD